MRLLFYTLTILVLALVSFTFQGCSDSRADEPGQESRQESSEAAGEETAGSDDKSTEGARERRDRRRGRRAGGEEAGASEPEAVPVEVARLERGPIESVLRFSTNLVAEREVEIYSEAARRVEELLVEEGDEVSKGDLLLRLQDAEQRTTLAKVKTELDRARREYERQERLFGNELISEQAMNDITYELERLQLELEEARRALSYTEVRAPIDGIITQRLVNVGDYVTVNQHLFDLVDFDSIVARVFVPEKELARLRPGLAARVTSPSLGSAEFTGRVERISPVVDPQSGTVKVTIDLPRSPGVRPGMYVDVVLVTAVHEDALLVPKRAVVYDEDQRFVFRLQEREAEDGDAPRLVAERIRVEPLLEDKRHVEVAPAEDDGSGLAAGDRVVVAGQAGLKAGTLVRTVEGSGFGRARTTEGDSGLERRAGEER